MQATTAELTKPSRHPVRQQRLARPRSLAPPTNECKSPAERAEARSTGAYRCFSCSIRSCIRLRHRSHAGETDSSFAGPLTPLAPVVMRPSLLCLSMPVMPATPQCNTNRAPSRYQSTCYIQQMVGVASRVSCATPVVGPMLGLLGIGIASAAAGQASRRTLRWYQGAGPHPVAWPPWQGVRGQDLAVDAVTGLVIWRVRRIASFAGPAGSIPTGNAEGISIAYIIHVHRLRLRPHVHRVVRS